MAKLKIHNPSTQTNVRWVPVPQPKAKANSGYRYGTFGPLAWPAVKHLETGQSDMWMVLCSWENGWWDIEGTIERRELQNVPPYIAYPAIKPQLIRVFVSGTEVPFKGVKKLHSSEASIVWLALFSDGAAHADVVITACSASNLIEIDGQVTHSDVESTEWIRQTKAPHLQIKSAHEIVHVVREQQNGHVLDATNTTLVYDPETIMRQGLQHSSRLRFRMTLAAFSDPPNSWEQMNANAARFGRCDVDVEWPVGASYFVFDELPVKTAIGEAEVWNALGEGVPQGVHRIRALQGHNASGQTGDSKAFGTVHYGPALHGERGAIELLVDGADSFGLRPFHWIEKDGAPVIMENHLRTATWNLKPDPRQSSNPDMLKPAGTNPQVIPNSGLVAPLRTAIDDMHKSVGLVACAYVLTADPLIGRDLADFVEMDRHNSRILQGTKEGARGEGRFLYAHAICSRVLLGTHADLALDNVLRRASKCTIPNFWGSTHQGPMRLSHYFVSRGRRDLTGVERPTVTPAFEALCARGLIAAHDVLVKVDALLAESCRAHFLAIMQTLVQSCIVEVGGTLQLPYHMALPFDEATNKPTGQKWAVLEAGDWRTSISSWVKLWAAYPLRRLIHEHPDGWIRQRAQQVLDSIPPAANAHDAGWMAKAQQAPKPKPPGAPATTTHAPITPGSFASDA